MLYGGSPKAEFALRPARLVCRRTFSPIALLHSRLSCLFLVSVLLASGASAARAESWIFRRSYYSHDPATHIQLGVQPRGGPYYARPFGASVNTGYRHLHSTIRVGGQTRDHVHVYESWVQFGEQF